MRITQLAATLVTTVTLASLASAQFTMIGPFTGDDSEGFDYQVTPTAFPTCVEDRVFHNQADLCGLNGGFAHITGGWGFGCSIGSNNTPRLFGGSNHVMYTFDATASMFGGFFGTNNPSASDGHIEFRDDAGNLLHADILTVPNDCTWNWHGWDSGGAAIKTVEIWSNYSSGGYMMMDDMEVTFGGGGGTGTPYCFGDVGSGTPCPCGNDNDGSVPESGCENGVFASGAQLKGAGVASVGNDTLLLATIIDRAFESQMKGQGFSFVEILTMCPTGWFIPTAEGPGYLDEELGAIHEVGELKKDGVLIEQD